MAYSVRGRFTNQERYSNRRANQLLQLTKTKARDTQILEEALQKALDATEKAASRGEVFNLVTSVLGFAIPGPVDDMVLKTINAAKQDSLRDDALKAGQIDMSEIDYLKKASQNAQTQLEKAQLKMLEPMKFSTRFTQDVVPVALMTFGDIFKSEKFDEFRKAYEEGGEFANASLLDRTKEGAKLFFQELKDYTFNARDYQQNLQNYLQSQTPQSKALESLRRIFNQGITGGNQ